MKNEAATPEINTEEWIARLALLKVPGVGDRVAKSLMAHCGSARAVFDEKPDALSKIQGITKKSVRQFSESTALSEAEEEWHFINRQDIQPLFYLDENYPERLKLCDDGPLILFVKGKVNFNKRHAIAMVGTRNATRYGLDFCEHFIAELKPYNPLVVSGLAYGVDIKCHRVALQQGLPTVAVLAHGLDRVYPSLHAATARDMQQNGGLVTEYWSGTNPDRENFPKRNRIVAGMCDAVIVVEAAKKGGALITAELANGYNREVFALPGRVGDEFSEGCNNLIKSHKAALVSTPKDLQYILGWEKQDASAAGRQQELFVELEGAEKDIWQSLKKAGGKQELMEICLAVNLPVHKVLHNLMNLELKGLVKSRPGKMYSLH